METIAGVYARESSDDLKKAPSIQEQIDRAKQYAEQNGIKIVQTYLDNGYSGGDWSRPAWNQLVRDSKRHLFKLVLVWNQDRIARDTEQFLWFYRNLKESYVKVYSLTEDEINMDTAGDRIKHTSLAMAAEAFRLITSDKVKRTYQSKKQAAEKLGTKLIWGRKAKQYDIEKIKELRQQGQGLRTIAKQFNCSYQTVRRLLQNTHSYNTKENLQNKEELQNNPII